MNKTKRWLALALAAGAVVVAVLSGCEPVSNSEHPVQLNPSGMPVGK